MMKIGIRKIFTTFVLMLMMIVITPAAVNAVSETGRDKDQQLAAGVWESTVYVTDSSNRNVRAHIIKINKGSNVSLKVSTAKYYTKNSKAKARKKVAKKWKKKNWGYATVADQAKAYEKTKDKVGKVIAGVNGDFYIQKSNGKTEGKLIMEGNVINKSKAEPFFAVLKDGSFDIREGSASTSDVVEAVGGKYWILKNGTVNYARDLDNNTITTVGITADQDVVIATVDGREPTSEGTSPFDVAAMMKQQGCVDAIMLDCGGSASFLTKRSGDKSLVYRNTANDGFARPVSSALLIVKNKKSVSSPSADTPAVSMENGSARLVNNGSGYNYLFNGALQSGFFTINNKQYLFEADGQGANRTIKIGKTTYTYVNGELKKCSDSKAGNIAIGFCGADNNGKNLIYAYHYGDKKLNIGLNPFILENSGKMADWKDVTKVPWQTEKHRVKTVVVGDGVKNIGDYFLRISLDPFNTAIKNKKTKLKSVTLPSSITTIGKEAFMNHDVLKKFTIPKNVKTIRTLAFAYNEKTTYTFKGKTPPTIKKNAFKTDKGKITWKVKKSSKWKKFSKSSKLKKKAGFKGKIKLK